MSRTTTYYCNLCGDRNDISELIGFEFEPTGHKLRKTFPTSCERHLCKKCAEALFQFLSSIRKKEKD